ncbi:MAG: Ig family protein [Marmoricola sp.]|nr:Ig family protein [Marmoricola sp.]
MASARHRHSATITALALTVLGLTGLGAPAQAATARSVTIKASKTSIVAGATVTFTGTVSKSPRGSTVRVQRKNGNAWGTVGTTRTISSSGAYTVIAKPPSTPNTYTYRAIAPRTSKLAGATSRSTVKVSVSSLDYPTITTPTALPDATRGKAYSVTLRKTGGVGTWSVPDGSLPTGLKLARSTGKISGTPTGSAGPVGVYPTFTETATKRVAFKALSLMITGQDLAITTDTLPDAYRGVAYSVTLTKTGLAGTWSTPQLPTGLKLNATTGKITGTPTAAAADYAAYLYFSETSTGTTVLKPFLLRVLAPKVTTTTVPDCTTGSAYRTQLSQTGLDGTWSLTRGQLPAGLTLTGDGLISGTPTAVGDYGITVTFTENASGASDDQGLLLHVSAPGSPAITTPNTLPSAFKGSPYSTTLAATPTGGTWSITYGSLPVGLSLNAATGKISGTPKTVENAIFVVTYAKGSTSNTKAFGLIVQDPSAIS